MVLNAQDLFLFMDKHTPEQGPAAAFTEIKWNLMSSSLFQNKSKEKCMQLAHTIKESGADIVMITEVGGKESLINFAKVLLDDQFEAHSLPSNSDRGIDMGYLVKKDLGLTSTLHSYAEHVLPQPSGKFSRDVLRLDLHHGDKPALILLLVHIKSKLDLRKKDFEGRTQRTNEVNALVDIYQKLETLGVPVLIGGDFNGIAGEQNTEEEFQAIYTRTDLKDVAYLAKIPDEDRFSYVYFTRGGNRFVQQIDYLFISEKFAQLLVNEECYFPRYKNLQGSPLPIPKRFEQKNTIPSDHYPFLATLKLFPLA